MSETSRCPDCGHLSAAGSAHCEACNFPLVEVGGPRAGRAPEEGGERVADPGGEITPPGDSRPASVPRRPLRRRSRHPQGPAARQALSLWLMFGVIAAAAVLYIAIQATGDRLRQPVEGSSEDQQRRADQALERITKDSTDVAARIELANILYDTANWTDAIIHYRAAIRMDSTQVPALVDLGVCYYNLGDAEKAQRHFLLALVRDPHQPVALFNLGIVSERQSDFESALSYYHRALQSAPPDGMHTPIIEALQRVQAALGRSAPPLPDGR